MYENNALAGYSKEPMMSIDQVMQKQRQAIQPPTGPRYTNTTTPSIDQKLQGVAMAKQAQAKQPGVFHQSPQFQPMSIDQQMQKMRGMIPANGGMAGGMSPSQTFEAAVAAGRVPENEIEAGRQYFGQQAKPYMSLQQAEQMGVVLPQTGGMMPQKPMGYGGVAGGIFGRPSFDQIMQARQQARMATDGYPFGDKRQYQPKNMNALAMLPQMRGW